MGIDRDQRKPTPRLHNRTREIFQRITARIASAVNEAKNRHELGKIMPETAFGIHLHLDMYGCDPMFLSNKDYLEGMLNELPVEIHMIPIAPARVIEVLAQPNTREINRYDPGGRSRVELLGGVIIQGSHITFHAIPEYGEIYLDIFTCDELNAKLVTESLTKKLDTQRVQTKVLTRGEDRLKYRNLRRN